MAGIPPDDAAAGCGLVGIGPADEAADAGAWAGGADFGPPSITVLVITDPGTS